MTRSRSDEELRALAAAEAAAGLPIDPTPEEWAEVERRDLISALIDGARERQRSGRYAGTYADIAHIAGLMADRDGDDPSMCLDEARRMVVADLAEAMEVEQVEPDLFSGGAA